MSQLFDLATKHGLLDSVVGDKGDRSQRIRLGNALMKMRDRVFGEYQILGDQDDHSGRATYRLKGPEQGHEPGEGAATEGTPGGGAGDDPFG